MYFTNFPKFVYDFDVKDKRVARIMTDITRNVRFRTSILSNITSYDEYDIVDGETPEIIAEKFYGNANYHWIVMLVNERFDYLNDFPMTYVTLQKHITTKYGVGNEFATHHYENSRGFVVNSDEEGAYPVSNSEYEERLNESKRRIKMVSPAVIDVILNNFRDVI